MPDNDYNIIKPVENLQNVGAMAPIDRRAEKRRRQGQKEQRRAATNHQDLPDAQQDETTGPGNDQTEQGSIDYRA
jgi:hypothetical protein